MLFGGARGVASPLFPFPGRAVNLKKTPRPLNGRLLYGKERCLLAWFTKGKEAYLNANIASLTHKLSAFLIDMDDAGPAAGAFKIRSITNIGTTVTVETGTTGAPVAHGLTAGKRFDLFGAAVITNVNGERWTVATVPTTTTFTFTATTAPTGAHTANTGYIADLSLEFLSSFASTASGARVSEVEISTTGRTTTHGILDLPDVQFASVPGPDAVELILVAKSGNTPGGASDAEGAQRLIMCQHSATPGFSGLPVTPNGGNLNFAFATQGAGEL